MLCVVAANTGLRASELASLTLESSGLSGSRATVRCQAGYTKNGQEAVLPVRSDIAEKLRRWLADKPAGRRLWDGEWASQRHDAEMIQVDPPSPRLRRGKPDGRGRRVRGRQRPIRGLPRPAAHVYLQPRTRRQVLSSSKGVHPRNAQALARHSTIDLTMNVYTHVVMNDLHDDVESLRGLPGKSKVCRARIIDDSIARWITGWADWLEDRPCAAAPRPSVPTAGGSQASPGSPRRATSHR